LYRTSFLPDISVFAQPMLNTGTRQNGSLFVGFVIGSTGLKGKTREFRQGIRDVAIETEPCLALEAQREGDPDLIGLPRYSTLPRRSDHKRRYWARYAFIYAGDKQQFFNGPEIKYAKPRAQ
jgi:hypothetical protein